jgi:hypothetical protein
LQLNKNHKYKNAIDMIIQQNIYLSFNKRYLFNILKRSIKGIFVYFILLLAIVLFYQTVFNALIILSGNQDFTEI